jgi:hypothetical protein
MIDNLKNRLKSFDTVTALSAVFIVVITSIFITASLIALPRTEDYIPTNTFNLRVREKLQTKSYILELETSANNTSHIEETKSVIKKRLNKFGVEATKFEVLNNYTPPEEPEQPEVSIAGEEGTETEVDTEDSEETQQEQEEEVKAYLKVTTYTDKDESLVDLLVSERFYFRILTLKEDANIEGENSQILQRLPQNYDKTDFDASTFRTIKVDESLDNEGNEAYFAYFKAWPHRSIAWNSFLEDNASKVIGIEIDGAVNPLQVDPYFDPELRSQSQLSRNPQFAVGITGGEAEAEITSILYNTGHTPVNYDVVEQTVEESLIFDVNYIEVTAAFFAAIIAIYLFTYVRNREEQDKNIIFILSTIMLFGIWMATLKLTATHVSLPITVLQGLMLVILAKVFVYRESNKLLIELPLALLLLLVATFEDGLLQTYAAQLITLSVLLLLIVNTMGIYINKMRNFLVK